jgi:hypothetical protein
MRGWFGLLLVPFAVAVITAAVPSLRDQARLQIAMLPRPGADGRHVAKNDPILRWLDSSAPRAPDFAAARPDSPDLLLAAALVSPDRERARNALQDLVRSDGRPVVWAAYVDSFLATQADYADLSSEDADAMLAAIYGWQEADPDNGLPVALEAWALWGAGEGDRALDRWTAASERPKFAPYVSEHVRVLAELFDRMGLPAPEAATAARLGSSFTPWSDALGFSALGVFTAGYSAAANGNAPAAIHYWQSIIDLGLRAEETDDSVATYRAGAALREMGASAFWIRVSDAALGRGRRGPQGGRFYYGPYHELYAAAHGNEADLQLVQRLAADAARLRMLEALAGQADPETPSNRAADSLLFGLVALGSVVLLPFALLLPKEKSEGRPATVSPVVHLALALTALLAAAVGAGLLIAIAPSFPVTSLYAPTPQQLIPAVSLPVFALGLAALLVAMYQGRRQRTLAYRPVFVRSLLATTALLSVFYLVPGLLAVQARADWLRQWRQPGLTELQLATRPLGARWHNPPILPGAWEECPPPTPAVPGGSHP